MDCMDADILQAIRIIDTKIASLQEARNRLASAFGVGEQTANTSVAVGHAAIAAAHDVHPVVHPAHRSVNGQAQPSGRKIQLAEFLQTNGPMPRSEILARISMPEGTVAYCLADKRFFEQLENGDWDITEYSRRGLERRAKTGNFQEPR